MLVLIWKNSFSGVDDISDVTGAIWRKSVFSSLFVHLHCYLRKSNGVTEKCDSHSRIRYCNGCIQQRFLCLVISVFHFGWFPALCLALQRKWILELPSFRSTLSSGEGKPRDKIAHGSREVGRVADKLHHQPNLGVTFSSLVCPLQDTKDVSSGPPFRMGQIRPSKCQPHKTLAILLPSQSPSYTNQLVSRQSLASLPSQRRRQNIQLGRLPLDKLPCRK
jgi:hypothetical protein